MDEKEFTKILNIQTVLELQSVENLEMMQRLIKYEMLRKQLRGVQNEENI